jgi:hypothetical protein
MGKHEAPGQKTKTWFGYTLIVISDMDSTLPLVWKLVPASNGECGYVTQLLDLLFSLWPECEPEVLVGDSEYDKAENLARACEQNYGIHPCFPLHHNIAADLPFVDHDGIGWCSEHGAMKLIQPEGFVDAKKRRALGLRPGESADLSDARLRWSCETCGVRATTRPKLNWRLYTHLHRGGPHKSAGLREAVLLRRLGIESLFSSFKGLKLGLGGKVAPHWVTKDRHMEWLVGGGMLGLTVDAYTHYTGVYAEVEDYARRQGWISDPKTRRIVDTM